MPLVGGTHMGKHQRQEAEERQKCTQHSLLWFLQEEMSQQGKQV